MEGETSPINVSEEQFDGDSFLSGFDLPEENEDTEGTETSAEAQPEQGAEEPKEAAEDPADFLTVRFNKEDKKLTRAQAVELAQKGMNYDHIKAELDSYRDGPIGKAMKAYADQAGMSVEKYAEMMAQQAEAAAEKKAVEELHEKYPDAPDELLRDYARLQREGNKTQAHNAEEAKRQREWADALAEYPDVKPETIPQDVHDAISQGKTPLEALREHELAELRTKVAELTSKDEAKKKRDDNRARAVGSMTSNLSKGRSTEADDILAGLNYEAY